MGIVLMILAALAVWRGAVWLRWKRAGKQGSLRWSFGHGAALDNLFSVASIAVIFLVRKFAFSPSFGEEIASPPEQASAGDEQDAPGAE